MRLLRDNFLAVLILTGLSLGVRGNPICRPYINDGVCSNYIANTDYIYLNGTVSFEEIENSLGNLKIAQGLSLLNNNFDPCIDAFTSFACSVAYPRCLKNRSSPDSVPQIAIIDFPCRSTCTNVQGQCSNTRDSLVLGYIKPSFLYPQDCSQISSTPPLNVPFPTSNCTTKPKLKSTPQCFPPLIVDTSFASNLSRTLDPNFCRFGCCLPCPQSYYLYPEGYLEKGFETTQIIRSFSAVSAFIVMLSFLLLPGRRSHPSALILFASLSIFLYSAIVFFSIGNSRRIQCINDVSPSTQENNGLCAVQGALLIFTSYATALWTGVIILNLHIHTVWNSNFMEERYTWIHFLGWGIPLILTTLALLTKSVAYQFAGLCFIKQEMANAIFFYPVAIVVIPSFVMHAATFIHIAKASQTESQESSGLSEFTTNRKLQALQVVKIQWRALLLAVVLVVTVITYWMFYFIELRNITDGPKNREFLTKWLACVQSNRGQNECSKIARGYMPSYGLLMMAELLASLIGIWLLAIFSNSVPWKGLGQWIGDKFRTKKNVDTQGQFLAI